MPTSHTKGHSAIRVAIIEDDSDFRMDLSKLIEQSDGFVCVGAYVNCESALEELPSDKPDVLLLDIELPGMSGSRGAGLFKERLPQLEILMLTLHEENESVLESLRNCASGYLVKSEPPERLLQAIREVMDGGSPMSMTIARMVAESFRRKPPLEPLSQREQEVLDMLKQGHSYQAIGEALFIEKSTVKFHIKNIYRKLQVTNKMAAAAKR